ncbi:hypothetical protein D3C84_946640 [compost metagenome]
MAADMAAGRTKVTASALMSIGTIKVIVVIAWLLTINPNTRPATPSKLNPRLICRVREMCFCTAEASTPPST